MGAERMGAERMHLAYIALGSNLDSSWGSPAATVARAFEELRALGEVERRSSLYETAPVGDQDQPAFINAAACLLTLFPAEALMAKLLGMERANGRDRGLTSAKGPRTLDLDLLLFDNLTLNSAHLNLPHPELAGRRFVLQPLSEIAPGVIHPLLGLSIAELLAALPHTGPNGLNSVKQITNQVVPE